MWAMDLANLELEAKQLVDHWDMANLGFLDKLADLKHLLEVVDNLVYLEDEETLDVLEELVANGVQFQLLAKFLEFLGINLLVNLGYLEVLA